VVAETYQRSAVGSQLPIGREGILERLQDLKLFIEENSTQAAIGVVKQLEELFGGDVAPPGIG
jgi:hypothetical protein